MSVDTVETSGIPLVGSNRFEASSRFIPFTSKAAALATLAVLPEVGKGDKARIDELAVAALESFFNEQTFGVRSVSCEGIKDGAAHLKHDWIYGASGIEVVGDLIADPVEGTSATADGKAGGRSLVGLVLGSEGSVMPWFDVRYMEKVSAPPQLSAGLDASWMLDKNTRKKELGARSTIRRVALNAGIYPKEVRVFALARERNSHIFDGLKGLTEVTPITAGDFAVVERSVMSNPKRPILLMGSGGVPEGVLSAMVNPVGFQGVLIGDNDLEHEILRSRDGIVGKYAGQVLTRQGLLGSSEAVISVASITGDSDCDYNEAFTDENGIVTIQSRSYTSDIEGAQYTENLFSFR